jgi:AcrB/AcrD/AcrF family
MIAVTVAGLTSYFSLGRSEDPNFTFRTMVVQAAWPGATLDDTLQQVTERIERKLQETKGLDFLRSYTSAGVTTIFVNLKGEMTAAQVPDIWYQVRKNVGDIRHTLPILGCRVAVHSSRACLSPERLSPKVAGFYSATCDRVMPPLHGLLLLRRVQSEQPDHKTILSVSPMGASIARLTAIRQLDRDYGRDRPFDARTIFLPWLHLSPDLNATLLCKLGRDRAIRIRAVQRRLCVALDEEVYASAQPFEVGTCRHASECRAVELARRGLCMCGCRLLRPLDAATAR